VAHTPIDGPLGLEGRHELRGGDQMPVVGDTPPDNQFGVFMYGKHQYDEDAWIKVDQITGLHGLGDGDDFREPLQGATGEVIYPGAQRGRSIVYEGRVCGRTLPDLRQQAADLRRAAAEMRERVPGSVTIVDPDATSAGYAAVVRCLALDMDDVQEFGPNHRPTPYIREFSLGLRAHDPRYVWYPAESLEDQAEGAPVTVENEGNAHALPQIDVIASTSVFGGTFVIQNLTLGVQLSFGPIIIPDQNRIRIDFGQRAATLPDTITDPPSYTPNSDAMPYLNIDDSDWWGAMEWGLGPGENQLQLDSDGSGGPLTFSVFWQHSAW